MRIGLIYPELMGTYGDRGNARILERRLAWRDRPAEVVEVRAGQPIPGGLDCYVLGGAEDLPQTLAAEGLMASAGPIDQALDGGAVMLAVCAGFQLLGSSYVRSDGKTVSGMGLVDAVTVAGPKRCIGEVVVDPARAGLPELSGFENHAGITTLGPHSQPLGAVLAGVGNGNGFDGAIEHGRLVATYLHGPVLARNPDLADMLLSWVTGPLDPLDDQLATRLRAERKAAARCTPAGRSGRLAGLVRRGAGSR